MSRWNKITEDEKQTVAKMWGNGLSDSSIADVINRNRYTVMLIRQSLGLESRNVRKYSLNEDCFATINDGSAYWLGFLMADGCNRGGKSLTVNLAASDGGHIEKLKEFCGYSGPIFAKDGKVVHHARGKSITIAPQIGLQIGSVKLCSDLHKWGIVPAKSLVAKVHPDLVPNRHFWRGCIDGDGSISSRSNTTLGLVGSSDLMQQYIDFIKLALGIHLPLRHLKNHKTANVFLYGAQARSLLKLLYSDCEYCLDRKFTLAQWHINRRQQRTRHGSEVVAEIHRLKALGLNGNAIAKKLGIHFVSAYWYLRHPDWVPHKRKGCHY